jgi:Flp pilus assembly protein TadD
VFLGRCSLVEEQYDRAEQFANHARTIAPNAPAPVLLLAQIADQRSGPRYKAEILGTYRKTGADDIRVTRQLADALARMGDFSTARSLVDSLIAAGVATFADYVLLARTSADESHFEDALSFVKTAMLMAPDRPGPVLQMAHIAEVRGDLETKVSILSEFLATGHDGFQIRLNLSDALVNQGAPDDALAVLQNLKLEQCSDRERFNLSAMYDRCSRPDLAMQCYAHIDPNGAYGNAVLLANALVGKLGCAEALKSHVTNGLADDNYYKALLANGRKLGVVETRVEGDSLPEEVQQRLNQYLVASSYFAPEANRNLSAALVSIVAPIHRAIDEANLVAQLVRQDYPALEAIVVINGPGVDAARLQEGLERSKRFQRVHVEVLPDTASLTTSLNAGLSLSRGQFLARFDADDIYMDRYVSRTVAFMRSEKADICGKAHLIIHFEKLGCATVFAWGDDEFRLVAFGNRAKASGSTLVMTRSVGERMRFNETLQAGEDRDFYFRAQAAGFRMALAPPFDHIAIRRAEKAGHTWKVEDVNLLANSRNGYFLSGGTVADVEVQTERFLKDNAAFGR